MRAFEIKKGTRVVVIKDTGENQWMHRQWMTKQDNLFFLEEMVLDGVLGKCNSDQSQDAAAIILSIAAGLDHPYAFRRDEYILLVDARQVEVH